MFKIRTAAPTCLLIFALALAGCVSFPTRIDTRLNFNQSDAQPYEPAIVIFSGGHREKSFLGNDQLVGHQLEFYAYTAVTQVEKGKALEKRWFTVGTRGTPEVLALPPGHYTLRRIHTGTSRNQVTHGVPAKYSYDFLVIEGEVLNLGYIETWYSRKDKGWLDAKNVEAREEAAIRALQQELDDPAPYVARMTTRLLNVPNKLW